jgi:hypothetical protein
MDILRNLSVLAIAALTVAVAPAIAAGCQKKTLTTARPSASVVLSQMTSIMNHGPDTVTVPGQRLARKQATVLVGYPGKRITIRLASGKSASVEICNY